MVAAIYLLLLIIPAVCASGSYKECSHLGSLAVINEVEMLSCVQGVISVCIDSGQTLDGRLPLSAGTLLITKITFTPSENFKVRSVEGILEQNKELKVFHIKRACDDLVNLNTGNKLQSEGCTLKANNKYRFMTKMPIKSVREDIKGQHEMIWVMYANSTENMFCVSVGVSIANNKTM